MDNFVALDGTLRIPVILKRLCVKGLFSQISLKMKQNIIMRIQKICFYFLFNFTAMVNNEYIHGMYLHILEEVTNESICLHHIFYIIPSMHNNGSQ